MLIWFSTCFDDLEVKVQDILTVDMKEEIEGTTNHHDSILVRQVPYPRRGIDLSILTLR